NPARLNGFARGRLIHRLLQFLPEIAPERREAAAAHFLAKPAHGLEPAEQAALAAEVLAVLREAAFAPVFGPDSRAEVPLAGLVGSTVISGQVDRLVLTKDAVLVVDYKSNRPPPATAET